VVCPACFWGGCPLASMASAARSQSSRRAELRETSSGVSVPWGCPPVAVASLALPCKAVGLSVRGGAIGLATGEHGPDDAGILVGLSDGGQARRLALEQGAHPGQTRIAALGAAQRRGCAQHQEGAQVAIAAFGDAAELHLAAGAVLARREPQPSREM